MGWWGTAARRGADYFRRWHREKRFSGGLLVHKASHHYDLVNREPAREVPIQDDPTAHGGGDRLLVDDVFRGTAPDPLGRRAGMSDGLRSVLVGVPATSLWLAARRSFNSVRPLQRGPSSPD